MIGTTATPFRAIRQLQMKQPIVAVNGASSYEVRQRDGQRRRQRHHLSGVRRQRGSAAEPEGVRRAVPQGDERAGRRTSRRPPGTRCTIAMRALAKVGPDAGGPKLCEAMREPYSGVMANYNFTADDMTGIGLSSFVFSKLVNGQLHAHAVPHPATACSHVARSHSRRRCKPAITNGFIYALVGMGLAVIFRGSRVINVMHGEFSVVGGDGHRPAAEHRRTIPIGSRSSPASLTGPAIGAVIELTLVRPMIAPAGDGGPVRPADHRARAARSPAAVLFFIGRDGYLLPAVRRRSRLHRLRRRDPRARAVADRDRASSWWSRCAQFFRRTTLGLSMTAASIDADGAATTGINVARMRTLDLRARRPARRHRRHPDHAADRGRLPDRASHHPEGHRGRDPRRASPTRSAPWSAASRSGWSSRSSSSASRRATRTS